MPRLAKSSSIVAVSSWGALRALPYYSLAGSSKGALESLARQLLHSEERIAETIRRTPIGLLAGADEVAYAAHFLCSDELPQSLAIPL